MTVALEVGSFGLVTFLLHTPLVLVLDRFLPAYRLRALVLLSLLASLASLVTWVLVPLPPAVILLVPSVAMGVVYGLAILIPVTIRRRSTS